METAAKGGQAKPESDNATSFNWWIFTSQATIRELELNGKEEKFTITVSYDTKQLYGQVTAKRQFTIYRE